MKPNSLRLYKRQIWNTWSKTSDQGNFIGRESCLAMKAVTKLTEETFTQTPCSPVMMKTTPWWQALATASVPHSSYASYLLHHKIISVKALSQHLFLIYMLIKEMGRKLTSVPESRPPASIYVHHCAVHQRVHTEVCASYKVLLQGSAAPCRKRGHTTARLVCLV